MGYPMTAARVIARNHIVDERIISDILRLEVDSAHWERDELIEAVRERFTRVDDGLVYDEVADAWGLTLDAALALIERKG
jgi:hypothetical protein